ncbi:hypothetical protein HZH66_005935 [Vespula vulgaris]|uniref:Uncharacterized protein n=1 Tax=Vespula vulgaris TaxID=7454 RepID=A0A834K7S5_VESVU|nr:hypothetical protein HZH66_005935 [Vespula vulgaris]
MARKNGQVTTDRKGRKVLNEEKLGPIVIQTIKRIPKHEVAVSKQYSITVSTAVAAVDGGSTAAVAAIAVAVAVATVTIAATAVRDTCYDKSRKCICNLVPDSHYPFVITQPLVFLVKNILFLECLDDTTYPFYQCHELCSLAFEKFNGTTSMDFTLWLSIIIEDYFVNVLFEDLDRDACGLT